MGWHVGMTEEEMKNHFSSGGDGGEASTIIEPNKSREEEGAANVADADNGDVDDASESEEGNNSSANTAPTTSKQTTKACPLEPTEDPPAPPKDHQHVYHLCRKDDWETSKTNQTPYFPRTFLKDGKFTRASLYLDDIADVANEYYWKTSPPSQDWIVLELDVQFLFHGLGIPVLVAPAPEAEEVSCLQIFGGISTHPTTIDSLVHGVYSMKRRPEDGKFNGMLAAEWVSPRKAKKKSVDDEEEIDDIIEIPTEDDNENNGDDNNESKEVSDKKSKKKKKGLFSKLKGSKKSAKSDEK